MADEGPDVAEGESFPPSVPFSEIAEGLTGKDFSRQADDAPQRLPGDPKPEPDGQPPRVARAEPGERQAPTPEPPSRTAPPPTPPAAEERITVRGKTYTVNELQSALAADPDLAKAIATGYNQFNDVRQRLDEERERRIRELEARDRERTAPPPARIDPVARKREIVQQYGPKVEKAVQEGWFNGDLAADYPDFAATALYFQDLMFGMGAAVLSLQQNHDQGTLEQSQAAYIAAHERALDTVAGSDEQFAPLKDPAHRAEFKKYLSKIDPDSELALDPAELEGMYLGFTRTVVKEALKAANRGVVDDEERARRRSFGARRSTGGPRDDGKPKTADEANFGSLMSLGSGR
jgi:hypothetical protein